MTRSCSASGDGVVAAASVRVRRARRPRPTRARRPGRRRRERPAAGPSRLVEPGQRPSAGRGRPATRTSSPTSSSPATRCAEQVDGRAGRSRSTRCRSRMTAVERAAPRRRWPRRGAASVVRRRNVTTALELHHQRALPEPWSARSLAPASAALRADLATVGRSRGRRPGAARRCATGGGRARGTRSRHTRDAADAVAVGVERRREDADPELARARPRGSRRRRRSWPAGRPEQPLAGAVVHAARRHDASTAWRRRRGQHALAGQRVDAAVGEGRGDHRQVAARRPRPSTGEVALERRRRGRRRWRPKPRSRWAIARLRWPVARSESKTSSVDRSGRPANRPIASRAAGRARSRPSRARTRPAAAIAPALTIGLSGVPVPGASVIALNASPVGSTPIRARTASSPRSSRTRPYVSGLEIDWMVNGSAAVADLVDVRRRR